MILSLAIITLLVKLTSSQYNPASSSPWYWATTIVTETVWTICTVEETQTVGLNLNPVYDSQLTCPQVIAKLAVPATVTNIAVPDAEEPVLTSVTVQPPTSPTSCYNLPTPTFSLEVIAFSANQISRDGTANATDPVFFYVGNNATSPEYVGTFIDGNRVLLDLSPDASAAGRVAILLPGGESLVFDQTGVHHFDAGCRSVSSVMIPSFMDQVRSIASAPNIHSNNPEVGPISGGYRSSALGKREMQSKNFTVQMVVESIIDAELQGPNMFWGPSPCTFVSRTPGEGEWPVFTWTCEYPGKQSAEKKCEAAFQNWLRPGSNSVSARGLIESGDDLFQYLPRFLAKAGGSLTNLLPGVSSVMQAGMKWLSAAQNAVIDVAEFGGESVCEVLHAFDEYKLVMSDAGLKEKGRQHTVGAYVSPPVDTIVGTLASHTTRMTREPPRAVVPSAKSVVSLENVTVSTFGTTGLSSILGTVTGSVAGRVTGRGEVARTADSGGSVTVMPKTEVSRVMQ